MPVGEHLATRSRCAAVVLAATAGAAGAVRVLLPGVTSQVPDPTAALVRVCLVALVAAVGWAWLATVSVAAEAWLGRPGRSQVPAPLRRIVLVCCGVALVLPAGAATADEHSPPPAGIAGLPMPERATGPAHEPTARPPSPRTTRSVVVSPGDSLWSLAAADLPAGAPAGRITARWHAIHSLNAAVIGPDPDLIHPGQRLALPPVGSRRST